MPRVKRGVSANKKRASVLKHTKGFMWGRSTKERQAKQALLHAWTNAFQGRKEKKRDYRQLWNTQINAALRPDGISYSQFIALLKKNSISVDRKIMAKLAQEKPHAFKAIVEATR